MNKTNDGKQDLKASYAAAPEPVESYTQYDKRIRGIFANFEIAVNDYAHSTFGDATKFKHLDKARIKAFEDTSRLLVQAKLEELNLITWPNDMVTYWRKRVKALQSQLEAKT